MFHPSRIPLTFKRQMLPWELTQCILKNNTQLAGHARNATECHGLDATTCTACTMYRWPAMKAQGPVALLHLDGCLAHNISFLVIWHVHVSWLQWHLRLKTKQTVVCTQHSESPISTLNNLTLYEMLSSVQWSWYFLKINITKVMIAD